MSKIQKRADKFIQCFYVGPEKWEQLVGFCGKWEQTVGYWGEMGVHIPTIMVY